LERSNHGTILGSTETSGSPCTADSPDFLFWLSYFLYQTLRLLQEENRNLSGAERRVQ
jgi:hypothetical protein